MFVLIFNYLLLYLVNVSLNFHLALYLSKEKTTLPSKRSSTEVSIARNRDMNVRVVDSETVVRNGREQSFYLLPPREKIGKIKQKKIHSMHTVPELQRPEVGGWFEIKRVASSVY